FVDVVTNQQLYVTALATYAATLAAQWQAVADVADVLQIDDLFQGIEAPPVRPSDLEHLPGLPCSHPCNPLENVPSTADAAGCGTAFPVSESAPRDTPTAARP